MQRAATWRITLTDTFSPLIRFTLRLPVIRREMTICPSSGSTPNLDNFSFVSSSSIWKTISTIAESPCFPMISCETLAPSTMPIEPIKIDLPAPVSPVRIFNPEEKSTSISSIIAKFFTCKFTNNSLLPFHYFNFVTFTRHPSFTPLTTA